MPAPSAGSSIDQVAIGRSSNAIAIASAELSHTSGTLKRSVDDQVAEARRVEDLSTSVSAEIRITEDVIANLERRASEIADITAAINRIASQTNLLALNATIEAARAGSAGKGFAVVADEVRSLAGETARSSELISALASEINTATAEAGASMRSLVARVAGAADHDGADIATSIASLLAGVEATAADVDQVARQAEAAADQAESIFAALGSEGLPPELQRVLVDLFELRNAVVAVFEEALRSGELSERDLFDSEFVPVPGTEPPKFSTGFDGFTDRVLPPLQEPFVARHAEVAFAAVCDRHGYIPTHNDAYCQPLTGDYDRDLVGNRTKRVYDDRTATRIGANDRPFLLQTYKRDTGEVMHDLSVPLVIAGRRWGAVRCGVRPST